MQSLFVISYNREVLIEKHWRRVTNRNVVDLFLEEVNRCEDPKDVLPILSTANLSLINVYRNNLFLLCVVSHEISPLMVVEFLHCALDTFAGYFKRVNESTIKENFSTIYQLLEEMCDNGFPLTTERNMLEAMIAPPSIQNRIVAAVSGKSAVSDVLPGATEIGSIPWRRNLVSYSVNSIYFDIVESIDCIVGRNGLMTNCLVRGEVVCTSNLSGIPDISVRFDYPRVITDFALHPCVRIARFESNRTLSFVPPDGTFSLLSYTVHPNTYSVCAKDGNHCVYDLPLPLYCRPQLTFSDIGGRIDIIVGLKRSHENQGHMGADGGTLANITKGLSSAATNNRVLIPETISVTIPFPKNVRSTDLKCNTGTVLCDETTKICTWTIPKINNDIVSKLEGSFTVLPGQPKLDDIVTIMLGFKLPNKSVSGISVADISCSNEKYNPYKYVRNTLCAGNFQIRCP